MKKNDRNVKQFSNSILTIFLFVGISISGVAQSTFYKYLFNSYSSGRNLGLDGGITTKEDTFLVQKGVSGHGANSSWPIGFDEHGNEFKWQMPIDSLIPDTLVKTYGSEPVLAHNGFFIRYFFENLHGKTRGFSVFYGLNNIEKWKTEESISLIQGNSQFGFINYDYQDTITRISPSGEIKFKQSVKSFRKINQTRLKIFTGVSTNLYQCYLTYSNKIDSCQVVSLDTLGKVILDTLFVQRGIHDLKVYKNQIITVEKDTSFHLVFHDLLFKETFRYSFSNEFPLTYGNMLLKDSLVTLIMYNNVDGIKYGTRNIPELRVINLRGKYLRKRYLRYNGGYGNIKPKNAIGPIIKGISYTSKNGYYMNLFLETGTLDRKVGILKTDSNIMANDTIAVPGFRLYLNQWDTILTPIKPKPTTVEKIVLMDEFNVFPNPAVDYIYIKSGSHTFIDIELVSSNGSRTLKGRVNINEPIDVSQIPAGIYILKISSKQGSNFQKIVIE